MAVLKIRSGGAWIEVPVGIDDHGNLAGREDEDHSAYIANSLLITRGDLIRRGASTPERIGLGTDGQALKSDGTDAVWEDDEHAIEVVIGDGDAAIPTGVWCALEVPYACTVKGWTLVSPLESGALVVDVWKDSYANWPPTVADTIGGSEKPTITATGNKGQDLTLTTWTTALAKGDWLIFNVDSVATITLATLSIRVVKT
jgi:hypothetical protein